MAFLEDKTYTIDRIENGIAICECLQTGVRITVDVKYLPPEAKEDQILRQVGESFVIEETHTGQMLFDLTNQIEQLLDEEE